MADPDRIRNRALCALAAVVAVALGVGGILAIGAYATARFAGLTDNAGGPSAAAHAVPAAPSHAPATAAPASRTSTVAGDSSSPEHQAAAPQAGHPDQQTRHQHARSQRRPQRAHQRHHRGHRHARRHQQHRRHGHQQRTGAVTLHAAQTRVRPMARVDLGGRCGCRSGTTLVVQRRQAGHWTRFPATATANNGRFRTWVMTGRRGPNEFRVVLPGGPASNPVTITVT